jgi:hypothetical protein
MRDVDRTLALLTGAVAVIIRLRDGMIEEDRKISKSEIFNDYERG